AAVAARGRKEPAGEPQVAEQDEQHDDGAEGEETDLDTEPAPEDRVVADARVPDRVGPELDADREHEDHEDRDKDRDDREDLATHAGPTSAPETADGPWRPSLFVAGGATRTLVAVAVVVVAVAVAVVVTVAARRSRGIIPGRLTGLATAEVVQDRVKHVSHGLASIADSGPEAGRGPGGRP